MGKTIILIASDGEGSAQNKAWVRAIESKYLDQITILGIADVRRVPRVMKKIAEQKFKNSPR